MIDEKKILNKAKREIDDDIYIHVRKNAINKTDEHFTFIVLEHLEKRNHSDIILTELQKLYIKKQKLEQDNFVVENNVLPIFLYNSTDFTEKGKQDINTYFQSVKDEIWSDIQSNSKIVDKFITTQKIRCKKIINDAQICNKITKKIGKMPKKLVELTYYPNEGISKLFGD
ncbi:MAG: hypothetical protein WC934_04890 [Acidithiobacillus sp.]|jgi:hypothetical protein|uniref:hypothetical protein n=1 Tax=Acidithiobacillus sp. TaxID=1872118 RepID=UPI00355FF881